MASSYQGNVPSRESIHVYYQKAMRLNMSRQASIEQLSEDESASGSVRYRRRPGGYRMESQDSTASRDSISRYAAPVFQHEESIYAFFHDESRASDIVLHIYKTAVSFRLYGVPRNLINTLSF